MGNCVTWTLWVPDLVKGLPAALVALVIGLVAAGIAYRQWQVSAAKFKLDLFERRYAIFEATWGFLSAAITVGPAGVASPNFTNLIPQARFLFGDDIATYMDEASSKMSRLWLLHETLRMNSRGFTAKEITENVELGKWFSEQASTGCKAKFGKYLDFSKWH